jgi:hypothetical protein
VISTQWETSGNIFLRIPKYFARAAQGPTNSTSDPLTVQHRRDIRTGRPWIRTVVGTRGTGFVMARDYGEAEYGSQPPFRFGWLEVIFLTAAVGLFFQLFPAAWLALLSAVDFRHWSRPIWFCVNLAAVAGLILVRYLPDWKGAWRTRRADAAMKIQRQSELKERNERRLRSEELRRRGEKGIDFY